MIEYSDKSWLGRRVYQIDPPRIRAKGSQTSSGKDFDISVELKSLNPEYDKIWLRHPVFIPGLVAIMLGIPLLMIISTDPISSSHPRLFGSIAWTLVVILIMVVFTSRKTYGIQFRTITGVPALLILQAGRRKREFPEFVAALQEAIRRAEQGSGGNAPELSSHPPSAPSTTRATP